MKRINNKGFTIIEVLIVMAIAAVIVVGILLAVPALQRNNRNSTRTTEGGRIAALVNECLSNKNGVVTACDQIGTPAGQSSPEIDYVAADFQQLTTNPTVGTSPATFAAPATTTYGANQAVIWFNSQCSSAGDAVAASTRGNRAFSVTFLIETSSGTATRCLSS